MLLLEFCHCGLWGVLQGFQTEYSKLKEGKDHDKLYTYETSQQDRMKKDENNSMELT